ncbi:MAG: hypothetical protein H2058_00590 [Muricauda sp.]|nr:hypothetical protein [Allomuricauda sp.]MBA4743728.1 hypothetical protein [Allomuricauda sp.]
MPKLETLPLEHRDKTKLRRQLYGMLLFPVVVIGIFWLFLSFMFNSGFADDSVGVYMMVAFSVLFFSVIAYIIASTAIDLKLGLKSRVSGKITDKRMHWATTGDRPVYGHKTRTRTRRSYYVYIDNEEFSVDYSYYSKARIGAEVQLDRAPKSGITLNLHVLGQVEDAHVAQKLDEEEKFLEKHIPHTRYTPKDYEALHRIWKTEIKKRLVRSSPFITIGLLMIISGFWSFVVLLFPIWVVPLFQFYRLYVAYRNYNRNKERSHKRGVPSIVEDKFALTSNRYANSNRIILTSGPLLVSSTLYDKLFIGDKVLVYKTQYGNVPLSIVLPNGEEVYLV